MVVLNLKKEKEYDEANGWEGKWAHINNIGNSPSYVHFNPHHNYLKHEKRRCIGTRAPSEWTLNGEAHTFHNNT